MDKLHSIFASHFSHHTRHAKILLKLRHLFCSLLVCLVMGCDGVNTSGLKTVVTELARENLSFSVLAVNLQLLEQTYGGKHVNWFQRYGRIASWMADTKNTPDLIALQEVVGQSGDAQPYDTLLVIINQIKVKTNVDYRIAYLSVSPTPQGLRPILWAGRALLYNPQRMTNTTSPAGLPPARFDDESITGIHPRKSLPCPKERPGFKEFCTLLDGEGISWISSARRPEDNRWVAGPAYARMLLKNAANVNIYNVHVAYEKDTPEKSPNNYLKQFNALSNDMESRFGSNRLYPPVVLGDFNLDHGAVLSHFKDYEIAGYARREVMGVLMGTFATFPAKQRGHFKEIVVPVDAQDPAVPEVSCGGVDVLWSDHCGIYVTISPVS